MNKRHSPEQQIVRKLRARRTRSSPPGPRDPGEIARQFGISEAAFY